MVPDPPARRLAALARHGRNYIMSAVPAAAAAG